MNLYNRVIRHKQAMDVCFLVHKTFILPHKVKLKGEWINMGFVESYNIGEKQNIELMKEEIANWEVCLDQYPKCYRYAAWRSLAD